VAWLLNLRGGDVPYNPVFLSYAVVTAQGATLFVDPGKVAAPAAAQLAAAGVAVRPYDQALPEVRALAAAGVKIWMDPAKVSFAVKCAATAAAAAGAGAAAGAAAGGGSSRKRPNPAAAAAAEAGAADKAAAGAVLERTSPVGQAKAVKNEAELAGMREAHLRDGVALVKFIFWLERAVAGGAALTECDVDEQLEARRAAQEGFVEPSFPTIAGELAAPRGSGGRPAFLGGRAADAAAAGRALRARCGAGRGASSRLVSLPRNTTRGA
jgi:Xaa-Pro aminopeptidase